MLNVTTLTHPGLVREKNEDSVLWDPALGLLAVADGMGGHNAGEVASRIALEVLQRSLRDSAAPGYAFWPFGFFSELPSAINRLRTAIKLGNREIYRTAQEQPECAGMGTTLTTAIFEGTDVWFANVGDSRLYTKQAGEQTLKQLTRDDSFLGLLADAPGIEPAILAGHPMRHLLTSVLGPRAEVDAKVQHTALTPGRLLMMSTDGLHGLVTDEDMSGILDAEDDLPHAAERLIQAALDAGGRDNITVALARYTP